MKPRPYCCSCMTYMYSYWQCVETYQEYTMKKEPGYFFLGLGLSVDLNLWRASLSKSLLALACLCLPLLALASNTNGVPYNWTLAKQSHMAQNTKQKQKHVNTQRHKTQQQFNNWWPLHMDSGKIKSHGTTYKAKTHKHTKRQAHKDSNKQITIRNCDWFSNNIIVLNT